MCHVHLYIHAAHANSSYSDVQLFLDALNAYRGTARKPSCQKRTKSSILRGQKNTLDLWWAQVLVISGSSFFRSPLVWISHYFVGLLICVFLKPIPSVTQAVESIPRHKHQGISAFGVWLSYVFTLPVYS